MEVNAVYSGEVYERMMNLPEDKKIETYRYELMYPFQKKWRLYNIPMKATKEGGYDVIMASEMLGFLSPRRVNQDHKNEILRLKEKKIWEESKRCIQKSLQCFEKKNIELKVKEYLYTLLLADTNSVYTKLNEGYCGDGGVPGYMLISMVPTDSTIQKLPMLLAHECNHNVRFQYIDWNQQVTLSEMLVTEGIAENFVAYLYGEKYIGPWVKKVDSDTLEKIIKPIIRNKRNIKGFNNITAYLYGDEIATIQGFFPVGMPYCGGYALGYYLIKYYLEKTKDDIRIATIRPASEILKEIEDFW